MSELKVDKITPRLGTTLTLGDAGDTINFGSGVLPNFENLTVTGDLTVDTNSLKVDSTNNFVGIGTASPTVALDVVGAITATGNITGTLATASQPNITSVGTLTSATVSGDLTVGTDKLFVDVSASKVGIGTTTLPRTLNINNSSGNASIGLDGTATSNPQIAFKQGGTDKGYVTYWDAYDTLALTDGSANGLHFKPSTLTVGIGTTNPAQILHLRSATPVIRMEDSDNATYNQILSNDGVLSIDTNGTERMRLTSSGDFLYGKSTTDVGTAGIRFIPSGRIFVTRDNDPTAYFRRNTSVGNIMEFNQAGTTIGYIGSYTGSGVSQFYISGADTGFKINSTVDVIAPSNATGGDRNNQIDFGASANAWKDGYFGGTVTAGGISLGDNQTINVGASNDLQIYHDGSNSYINEQGTGNLLIRASSAIRLQRHDGTENFLTANQDGACELYYNGTKKLETTSGGINVTGAITVNGSALGGETAFAYVNFNGTGTVSIRGSYNVSSITDHQTGDYSVNFSSSASNSTYTAVGTGGDPNQDGEPFWTQAISTSAWRGWLKVPNAGRNDRPYVMATIHGG